MKITLFFFWVFSVAAKRDPVRTLHTYGGVEWKSTTSKVVNELHEKDPTLVRTKVGWGWPMHYAIMYDAPLETVQRLYQLFPNALSSFADDRQTCLSIAAMHGRIKLIPYILAMFPSAAETKGANGNTPLKDNFYNSDIKALLSDPDSTIKKYFEGYYVRHKGVLSLYSTDSKLWKETNVDTVSRLLQGFTEVPFRTKDENGRLPQDYAFQFNAATSVVNKLVEISKIKLHLGVFSLYSNNKEKWIHTTPGMVDALNAKERLPSNKNQVKTKHNGLLPIHLAALNKAPMGTLDRLHQLYTNGIKTEDKFGRLPIHCLILGDADLEIIKRFYNKFPGSLKAVDNDGLTPLHYAAKFERDKLILFMVEKYPNALNVQTKDAKHSPLDLAQKFNKLKAIQILYNSIGVATKKTSDL